MNIYEDVTSKILAAMESGSLPWVRPWSGGNGMPRNATTQRPYSGCNVPLLWLAQATKGYASDNWLTYKQAQSVGAQVRKGERGTMIVYASTFEKENAEGEKQRIPFLKAFSVFNVEQCDNAEHLKTPGRAVNTEQRNAGADAFLAATGAVISHGGDRAFYAFSEDRIQLPGWEHFKSATGYYETALHELVHWTGHAKRCNREFGKRFGDQAYAAEELVAELGAAFLCAEYGFDAVTQHAAYVQQWIKLLKSDSRAFVTAASKASQAHDWLRSKVLGEEQQQAA